MPAWLARALLLATGILVCPPGHAAAPEPDGPAADKPIADATLAFLPGATRRRPPALWLSVGTGRFRRATLDTGSWGTVVAADAIPDLDRLPQGGPARLTYTSSGRVMVGRLVQVALSIAGSDGPTLRTQPVWTLAVSRVECLPRARDCRAGEPAGHVAMLGVGLTPAARIGDNPLLHLPGQAPASAGRFALSACALRVGQDATSGAGFRMVTLSVPQDGLQPGELAASVSLDGGPPVLGTALVDSGVERMFLSMPGLPLPAGSMPTGGTPTSGQAHRPDPVLPPGSTVDIRFGGAVEMRFVASPATATASAIPVPVVVVRPRPTGKAFVNTSARLLDRFDVLFDAPGQAMGFRPGSCLP